jgi:hypothetical protein
VRNNGQREEEEPKSVDVYLLHTQKEATPRNPAEIIMIISCQTLGQEFQVTNTHARASQQQLHSFLFLFLPSRNISISILLKWATSFFAEELRPIAQKNRAPNSNRRKNQICVGGGKWRANESLTHHPPPSYIPSDWKEDLIWSWSKSNQDLVSVFFLFFLFSAAIYFGREERRCIIFGLLTWARWCSVFSSPSSLSLLCKNVLKVSC